MKSRYSALLILALALIAGSSYARIYADEEEEEETTTEPISNPVPAPDEDKGLPIFKFSENSWFELTIPDNIHPDTGMDIEAERNRDSAKQNSERDPLFSDNLQFLNQLQLRYHIRFR